jgi:hypothetical protein
VTLRILITGSRRWTDYRTVTDAIDTALATHASVGLPVLIHGDAPGADRIADAHWRSLRTRAIRTNANAVAEAEVYPARWFTDPKARNQHMVDLGATVCLAFASDWASGTGHCARAARRAGIQVIDYGVSTAPRTAKEVRR